MFAAVKVITTKILEIKAIFLIVGGL